MPASARSSPSSHVVRVVLAPARLLERVRGRRRLGLIVAYALIAAAIGVMAWRESRLIGLPDIGEPFDPAPVLALRIPDDENAFVLYRQASARARRDGTIERRIVGGPWP